MSDEFLASDESFSSFIVRFEDGTWPAAEFRHSHHLAVAACYLAEEPWPLDRMRANIRNYNVKQGGENTESRGYHETITRFWLEVINDYLTTLNSGLSKRELAGLVVTRFGAQRDLYREYYDFDVLGSQAARAAWVAPTVRPESKSGWLPTNR